LQLNKKELTNAITVDVEDFFQVSAFERYIAHDDWERIPGRVERNTEEILELFERHEVNGTFFVLGWVGERHPALLRRISGAGHEVASHSYRHERVNTLSREAFFEDASRTKKLLEDITGEPVKGYRAPTFSIGKRTLWALEELEAIGYEYSSSVYPIRHDLYGMPDAPRFPFRLNDLNILEVPISTVQIMGCNLPAGGGGYFRLAPYVVSRWMLRRINQTERRPCVFYFHPWELDPEQPRHISAKFVTRFRHYKNLKLMGPRIDRLLRDFRWGRMDDIFLRMPLADQNVPEVFERNLSATIGNPAGESQGG
jgi:polysaccharide deacetylase family protein (PEP-CTERM system associated)